jgi:hypothetical protein
MPSLAQQLLPWLIILGLLAFKFNRTAAAWLIWLPIGCVMAITLTPALLPSGTDFFIDVIVALIIGYAALWLLANQLRRQHGFLTFLCVLLALAGFSVLAALLKQNGSLLTTETLATGIILLMGVLITSIALSLAGLICRHRYRPAGLYLWLFLLLAAIWLLIALPFVLIVIITSGGKIPWSEFFVPFVPVLAVVLVNFAMLLPFLILSSASPFHRERLKALLHVKPEVSPTLNATEPVPGPNP